MEKSDAINSSCASSMAPRALKMTADESAAAPACGWPRFDAALRALRDAAGEDAPAPARDEAERFAALVRILVCRLRGIT